MRVFPHLSNRLAWLNCSCGHLPFCSQRSSCDGATNMHLQLSLGQKIPKKGACRCLHTFSNTMSIIDWFTRYCTGCITLPHRLSPKSDMGRQRNGPIRLPGERDHQGRPARSIRCVGNPLGPIYKHIESQHDSAIRTVQVHAHVHANMGPAGLMPCYRCKHIILMELVNGYRCCMYHS